MVPPSNRTGRFFIIKVSKIMKNVSIMLLSSVLLSTPAFSEESVMDNIDVTLGAERNLEAETNAIYGSVGLGVITVGATMEDTSADSGKFNISKYEIDSEHEIAGLTVYMENDFDDGFKHTETTIGAKIKF